MSARPSLPLRTSAWFGARATAAAEAVADRGWARALALLVLCLALFLPGIADLPVTDRDEARFAQATKQMLETGDYVDIRFQDEPRWKKPIGIYWMQAASVAAVGGPEGTGIWAWRIPSLLGAILAVFATAWTFRPLMGAQSAFLAAGLTATSLVLAGEANIAKTDAMLLGLTMLSLGAWVRLLTRSGLASAPPPIEIAAGRALDVPDPDAPSAPAGKGWKVDPWHPHAARAGASAPVDDPRVPRPDALALRLILWGALGLAVLVKGPIAPAILALAVLGALLAERTAAPLRALGLLSPGPILFVALVIPWLIAIHLASDGGFWAEALGRDFLGKLAEGQEKHGAPPGTYLGVVWAVLWPWAPLILLAAPYAWRTRGARATAPLLAIALVWWLIIEATPTKLPHYLMPAAPAAAGLVALWLTSPVRAPSRWQSIAAAVLFALVGGALALADVGLPLYVNGTVSPWGALLALAGLLFVGLGTVALWSARRRDAVAAMIAAAVLLYPATLQFALPSLTWGFPSQLMARAAAPFEACAGRPADTQSYREPSLVFLQGTGTRLLLPSEAAAELREAEAPLVWIEDRRRDQLDEALNLTGEATPPHLRELTSVFAFNPNRGGTTTLRLFTRDGVEAFADCP
ncbi:glycosyltransferase family 39 protein [Albimonas sp. CAU 1670]|uniref:ArnT family glycosyltransferase n=1 Tax=Albimonas sp. CAU 1670 TaxID=3032599 RepID=UPI0023D9DC5B|nr:glycosyltransferase family 39 protein [Albimonas sp. CAU 1670]MDF2232760.1 glycosyltransferase family 39 protein [Albimonas sp. CAU 1670]